MATSGHELLLRVLCSIGMGDKVEHASTVTSSAFPFLLGRKKRVRARGDCIPPLPDATRMMDEAGSDPKAALVAIGVVESCFTD